jgi:hypothetical protein
MDSFNLVLCDIIIVTKKYNKRFNMANDDNNIYKLNNALTNELRNLYRQDNSNRVSLDDMIIAPNKPKSVLPGLGNNEILSRIGQENALQEEAIPVVTGSEYNYTEPSSYDNKSYSVPSLKDTGISDAYFDKVAKIESGGDYNAVNKGSGATGLNQILRSTGEPYLKKYGATWDDFKRSPKLQDAVMREHTANNVRYLKKHGVPINDFTLYGAHQQGAGGFTQMYKLGKGNARNIASNLPNGGPPTVQNWMKQWSSRLGV